MVDSRRTRLPSLKYILTDCRHGKFLANPSDEYIGTSLIKYGEYSEFELDLIRQVLPANGSVIEVGANIGAHTVPMAKLLKDLSRLYAIEPQPVIFQNLCANLALNGITNAYTYNAVCGSCSGNIWFPDIDYSQKSNFGGVSPDNLPVSDAGRSVEVMTIDSLKITDLRFLKIDVEGWELEVLKGAVTTITKCTPIIYLENDRAEKSAALIKHIAEMGYRMWWHRPRLFNPDNWRKTQENLWPNMISKNMLCIHTSQSIVINGLVEVSLPD